MRAGSCGACFCADHGYNRKFNCFVRPKYDGSHQTFPDLNLKGLASRGIQSVYPSQKDCVWMIKQNGGGICDHEVGTGKTLIMCIAAHEMKRLNLAHKPMIIGLKANVAEIAATYQAAYPNARILYASEKDFSTANRVRFFNNIKNNDYVFLALWKWAKRRHSKKGKQWIKDRYWHNIRGNSWTFAAKFKKSNGKEDQLTLLKLASSFPFLQYTQIKGDMNPFDADCRLYFNKRMKSKMLVTLKGRKSLLYLWEKQGRKCPICGEPIDTHKAWNVMPTVQDGRKCNLLVHDECFKLSRKTNGNKK